MADPIPTVDPALLAAQAKAGQAGVDAYNAAIASMQQQRQTAVQQAMQEAAMRGAPAGSAESVQGQITGPYDQRIASLTQAGGAYQADLSARDRRMADYNAATQAARSYIPQQVEQQVAPIRARGEFDVRQEQMRGEQNVAGINADTQLQMARMAAAAQAAEIAAAKAAAAKKASGSKGEAINQTQLRSALTQQATADIQGASQQVQQAQAENIIRAQVQQAVAGAKRTKAQNTPAAAALAGRSYWDTMAASYTGKAAQEAQRTAHVAATPPPEIAVPSQMLGAMHAQGQYRTLQPGTATPPLPVEQADTGARAAAQQIAALQARIAQSARPLKAIREQADVGYGNAMNEIRRQNTSQYGWVTPTQLGGMDPLAQWAVQNAPGRFSSGTSAEQMLMGAPYQTGTGAYTGEPVLGTNPYAADVMRQAQILAAGRMQDQGYDITDADIYGALGTKGMSAYDASRELSGQPTAADEISADERDRALAEQMATQQGKVATAAEKAQTTASAQQSEADARQYILGQVGRVPSSSYGTPQQIAAIIQDPSYGQAQAALQQAIADIEGEGEAATAQAVDKKLRESDTPMPAAMRRLLIELEL